MDQGEDILCKAPHSSLRSLCSRESRKHEQQTEHEEDSTKTFTACVFEAIDLEAPPLDVYLSVDTKLPIDWFS